MTNMKYLSALVALIFALSAPAEPAKADTPGRDAFIHHDLSVTLDPKSSRIDAEDTVTVPRKSAREIRFLLHKGMSPSSQTPGVRITTEKTGRDAIFDSLVARLPAGLDSFTLRYGGKIHHPLDVANEQSRGFSQTPGVISEEGVFLSGSSFWYPVFGRGLVTFSLRVRLPDQWDAVSQGRRTVHQKKKGTSVTWESPEPQDEIFLVAARFTEYSGKSGGIDAMAFLRTPDKGLAEKYLGATSRYIAMYDSLIGPYPYRKFALVENFWETGFGMPSFTLLGSKVIRLPFIINSSYPHEILHNWWGNSVFPDYATGNWSEGLTAYLADHLIKEQDGEGAEYREAALQKYADYVLAGRDFPLTEFRSRHSPSTEAIGYGKALMFFHMLRLGLGDRIFLSGLQDFYRNFKFRSASFGDLRKTFERVSGKNLSTGFSQWVTRQGAPELRLAGSKTTAAKDGYLLVVNIEQVQPGAAYHLRIPVAVTMEGRAGAYQTVAVMDNKSLELRLHLPARPLRIDVDPEFDVFRRLDRRETPPAISQALGAKKMLIILPSEAGGRLRDYGEFAKALAGSGPDVVEIRSDREVKTLPSDRAVTIIGWENRFLGDAAKAFAAYGASVTAHGLRIGKTEIPAGNHSVVLASRNPVNQDMAFTFIAADPAAALPGLARKFPHYHKYSYLAFEGQEPVNVAKGRWPVIDSPMTGFLADAKGNVEKVSIGKLAARRPLAALPPVFSQEQMTGTVKFLSGDELGGRGFGSEGLEKAADFIAEKFRAAGLEPGGDEQGRYFETWEDTGGDPPRRAVMKNVIGIVPGRRPDFAGQSVVVGAHYDHLGSGWPDVRDENKGKIHPGADDNASGVAVLIELARFFAEGTRPDRSIVFIAFTGEEAGKRGSKYYVAHERLLPATKCIGMVNLDTVGRLDDKKLLVLGADSAAEWQHIFRGAGLVTGVGTALVAEPLDSSDQKSFQDAGVPAVQIFTGPHQDYHRPSDTADKIDREGLVKVASVAKEVVEYLAAREGPMTAMMKREDSEAGPTQERKTSLGTVPDFAFSGHGYRLAGVLPGSPAEASGLREGDIIIRIDSSEVKGLKDVSDILKSLKPGTRISIIFLRGGKEITTEAELKAK